MQKSVKYLGNNIIDNKLNFKDHIQFLLQKTNNFRQFFMNSENFYAEVKLYMHTKHKLDHFCKKGLLIYGTAIKTIVINLKKLITWLELYRPNVKSLR